MDRSLNVSSFFQAHDHWFKADSRWGQIGKDEQGVHCWYLARTDQDEEEESHTGRYDTVAEARRGTVHYRPLIYKIWNENGLKRKQKLLNIGEFRKIKRENDQRKNDSENHSINNKSRENGAFDWE